MTYTTSRIQGAEKYFCGVSCLFSGIGLGKTPKSGCSEDFRHLL